MLSYKRGDMWSRYGDVDLFVIAVNSTVTAAGRLVMGAGIAKEARDRFPGLDGRLGNQITNLSFFGFMIDKSPDSRLGLLQTKYHFHTPTKPTLLRQSIAKLKLHLLDNPGLSVAMNMPGTGNGKLGRNSSIAILHSLEGLSNQIEVWEYGTNKTTKAR